MTFILFSAMKQLYTKHLTTLNEIKLVDDLFSILGLRSCDIKNDIIIALSHRKVACAFRCRQNQ